MADKTIPSLTAGAAIADADPFESVQSSASVQQPASAIATYVSSKNATYTAPASSDLNLTTTTAAKDVKIKGNSAIAPASIAWNALTPNNLVFFTATRAMRVKAILGRLQTAQGTAATVSVYKAPSATAVSGGTVLHSGSFNCNGTPDANQTLTLSVTAADLDLAAGDSLGIVTSGLFTVSVASLTVHLAPI